MPAIWYPSGVSPAVEPQHTRDPSVFGIKSFGKSLSPIVVPRPKIVIKFPSDD